MKQSFVKRAIDFSISLIGCLILVPVLITVAIIIKCDSTGPVFYRCLRIGRFGQSFSYFKFRSMYVGTQRVTDFGRFIRRWHIDELPELLLVLIGRMSLVGPRPIPPDFLTRNHESYANSMKDKPGITGLLQIRRRGHNKNIDFIIFLNNWYAEHGNLKIYFSILFKTLGAIMRQNHGVTESVALV